MSDAERYYRVACVQQIVTYAAAGFSAAVVINSGPSRPVGDVERMAAGVLGLSVGVVLLYIFQLIERSPLRGDPELGVGDPLPLHMALRQQSATALAIVASMAIAATLAEPWALEWTKAIGVAAAVWAVVATWRSGRAIAGAQIFAKPAGRFVTALAVITLIIGCMASVLWVTGGLSIYWIVGAVGAGFHVAWSIHLTAIDAAGSA